MGATSQYHVNGLYRLKKKMYRARTEQIFEFRINNCEPG